MDIKIEIRGNDDVAKHYAARSKGIEDAIERIVGKVALNVERFGKGYSPVDTGLMRSTIYPVFKKLGETWVGPKTNYAKYVHARTPFMFAARQDADATVQSIIKAEVRRAIN